jgi:ABC-type lipoprotein release transport system permease subunit
MPVKIYNDKGELIFIHPTEKFQRVPPGVKEIKVDDNFYVGTKELDS